MELLLRPQLSAWLAIPHPLPNLRILVCVCWLRAPRRKQEMRMEASLSHHVASPQQPLPSHTDVRPWAGPSSLPQTPGNGISLWTLGPVCVRTLEAQQGWRDRGGTFYWVSAAWRQRGLSCPQPWKVSTLGEPKARRCVEPRVKDPMREAELVPAQSHLLCVSISSIPVPPHT